MFITFEGIEGSGKTTQIRLLDGYLRSKGLATLLTREPGGTLLGDAIRRILLSPENAHIDPVTELFLYEAARCQHVREVIRPALAAMKIVLCDRYADATIAYQGTARAIGREIVETLHRIATDDLHPDLTVLLDCPIEWGLKHAMKRNRELDLEGSEDRFEREERTFHEQVRRGYLEIASREPDRIKIVDGSRSIEEVHDDIVKIATKALKVMSF